MHYDLTAASVNDLAQFVFDHAVVERADDESRKEWYWTEEFTVVIDPTRQLELAASLFANAGDLQWRYSEEQLEQGLWFIFGPGGDEWFARLLRNDQIPIQVRQRFITNIFALYERLLSDVELETATFMLWDLLIGQFYSSDVGDIVVPTELEVAMFETLARILTLPDQECQRAALHGLGHLRHRGTTSVVAEYLTRCAPLPDELVEYASRVRDGKDVL